MATTVTRQYRLMHREHLMDSFRTVPDLISEDLGDMEQKAIEFAEDHPGHLVQVHSNTDGFEVQYRVRDGIIYRSFGHGWQPYE